MELSLSGSWGGDGSFDCGFIDEHMAWLLWYVIKSLCGNVLAKGLGYGNIFGLDGLFCLCIVYLFRRAS